MLVERRYNHVCACSCQLSAPHSCAFATVRYLELDDFVFASLPPSRNSVSRRDHAGCLRPVAACAPWDSNSLIGRAGGGEPIAAAVQAPRAPDVGGTSWFCVFNTIYCSAAQNLVGGAPWIGIAMVTRYLYSCTLVHLHIYFDVIVYSSGCVFNCLVVFVMLFASPAPYELSGACAGGACVFACASIAELRAARHVGLARRA